MNKEYIKIKTQYLISLCKKEAESGNIVITGHDMPDSDSIISAVMLRELLKRHEIAVEIKFGTRPDGVTERTVSELGILDGIDFDGFEPDDKLVLVDHHVTFYKNETVACVDHHTTPPEPDFEFNLVLSASSCGKIVFDMARSVDAADGWLEKLAIYSVYLDTQSCLAPKFDKNDILWIKEGIKRLDLDENDLVKKGFCLNSIDERSDVLAMYAYKRYEFGGKVGASTCIQIDDTQQDWQEKITEIIEFLKMKREGDGIALWALVVNKPVLVRSDLYFIREDGVEKVILDRLASRSRDVVPHMKNI